MTKERFRHAAILSAMAGTTLGNLASTLDPIYIGALIDNGGLSAVRAGAFGALSTAGLAVGMFAASQMRLRRSEPIVAVGSALLIGGLLAMARPLAAPELLGAIMGFGAGLLGGVASIVAGASARPEQAFALAYTATLVLLSGLIALVGWVGATASGKIFVVSAMAAAVLVPAMFGAGALEAAPGKAVPRRAEGASQILLPLALFGFGAGGSYPFFERAGQENAVPALVITAALSFSTLAGLAGAGGSAWLGIRFGRAWPAALGAVVIGAGLLMTYRAAGSLSYTVGVTLYWVGYLFTYPYLLGATTVFDRSGRLAAIGGSMVFLFYSAGTYAAGWLAQSVGQYRHIGDVAAATCLAVAGLLLWRRHALDAVAAPAIA